MTRALTPPMLLSSPAGCQRAKQHAGWMKRLQCALEPSTDRRLAEISNQAKQLAAELLVRPSRPPLLAPPRLRPGAPCVNGASSPWAPSPG